MGVRIYHETEIKNPIMFVGWPGIGNIGILAVKTLKDILGAEEFGEIESWDFFYPQKVTIREGLLENLEFPGNKFFYSKLKDKDIIFFVGDEQPSEGGKGYGRGEKAYRMANLVMDIGVKFGCQRIYTSGACVSLCHHQLKPRVCAVVSSRELIKEAKRYSNTVLMSKLEERSAGEGMITGLNGLLLAIAKMRGVEGMCLMGEIPDWLSGAAFPYPKASRSVLEVFGEILGIDLDLQFMDGMERKVDEIIEGFYSKFPPDMKKEYDKRKSIAMERGRTITIQAQIYIDEKFKKGSDGIGEEPV